MRNILLTPGALHDLAEQQTRLDFGGDTSGELARLRRVADALKERCANLVDAIANAPNKFARDALAEKLAQLEPEVAKATGQIHQYEAVLRDHEARRQFIADLELEVLRYQAPIRRLDIANLGDIQYVHSILLSLGTKVTVARRENGSLAVDVDLNLRRGLGTAWFPASTPQDIQADIDAAWPGAAPESMQIWAQVFEKMPRREEWQAFVYSHPDVTAAYLELAEREMARLPAPNDATPTTTTGSSRPTRRPSPR